MLISRRVCDRLASKSLTLCDIAAVAGWDNSAVLMIPSRLEGWLSRMFAEKRLFTDVKTKRNSQMIG